ncbi:ABC transporter ATP-binding protein [Bacteroidales bacterium OttesenSCG-928-B11]|nr:ABC transporter ATP-binding protein [Bacteroidales bacterium OttesenSCG-928-E04]MDL2311918.1 ABC transporter ATP-binding protein [Bacteroidales bacterium OttesenSCG-928-B11]
MIQINSLVKEYSGIVVLNIPELTIPQGESFGLVGNNGAGKTTLFRLILDLTAPFTGDILIDGLTVARHEEWKNITASFLDESFLIDFYTPEEYFVFVGKLYGRAKEEIDEFLLEMEELFNGEIMGKKKLIREYSKGNQKKIGIAAALLGKPKILILDEPFTALDPTSQIRLKRILNDYRKKENMTMLISSHDLNHITDVCSRIVILEKGRLVRDIETAGDSLELLKELESYFNV